MIIEKHARATLTAIEMDADDELHFTLDNGQTRVIKIERTWANIFHTTLNPDKLVETKGAVTNYRFNASLNIDGVSVGINREIGTQKSFYQPRCVMGLQIWIDAVSDIFDFLLEDHGVCRPRKRLRMAIQQEGKRICPVRLHPWCPLPEGGLKVEDCYNGEDVWLGAYFGAAAHGGLDINHPAGTPLWAPINIDSHGLFNSLANGDNNNRWRGVHSWADGSKWILQAHHIVWLRADADKPIEAGSLLADAAGVYIGDHEHSHFVFRVVEPGTAEDEAIMLDPWILFWQMYRDLDAATV